MEISYHGGNCIEIATKQATLLIDGNVAPLGIKDIKVKSAVHLATQAPLAAMPDEDGMLIDGPGEYEIKDISVRGVPAERMIDHDKSQQSTIYRIVAGGVAIAVLGHAASPLTEDQLEGIGVVDIAIIPVGGNGYTFDSHQAVQAVRQIDPKVVIPTHYEDKALKYEVPQMPLEAFVKELGAANQETTAKLKIKNGIIPEVLTLIELTRS